MVRHSRIRARFRSFHYRQFLIESLEIRTLLSAIAPIKPTATPDYAPGEVLVQYRSDIAATASATPSVARLGTVIENLPLNSSSTSSAAVSRIRLNPGISVEQAVAEFQTDPAVEVAEPNWILQSAADSNDPLYTNGSTWGLYGSDSPSPAGPNGTTNPWGSHAEQVWQSNVTGSSSVYVGILDEGVQITHPDLINNIWVNPFETPGDGIDNDGNGYIDDVNGWDFFNNDNTVNEVNGESHGTHVAGTVGAQGGNGVGVAGVAWNVTMIPLKFMQSGSGTVSNAIKAIKYLTDLKTRHGLNIVASNNSWGGNRYSQLLHDALISAAKQEILVVASAGNASANNDTTLVYPANYDTTVSSGLQSPASYDAVISVASISQTGTLGSTSNFGAVSVDIAAPGESIVSTVPGGYGTKSGTSMAAPHVTGAIVLFAAAQSGRVPASLIRSAILAGATPTSSLTGKTVTGGRLNAFDALQYNASIQLDQHIWGPNQPVTLTVAGTSANQNTAAPDTLSVMVSSTTESAPLYVTLTETGANTGLFRGSFRIAVGTPASDQVLQVTNGDVITAHLVNSALYDTAIVDSLAPSVSNITVTPAGAKAGISWNNSEPSTAVIRFGRSSQTLDRSIVLSTATTNVDTTIYALNAATAHYFQLEVTDRYGNVTITPIQSFTTNSPAPILFIDDDQNATLETYFRTALNANAFAFDEWNVANGSRLPTATDLITYPLVIWNTGADVDAPSAGLSTPEQDAIATYLDHGGRMFISGQDILFNTVSDEFLHNYLKIDSYIDDVVTSLHTETGVIGNPITTGMSISSSYASGYSGIFVDAIQPVPGANGLLLHNDASVPFPFSGVSWRGNYASGGFGLVFSTVPFESLSRTAPAPNNQNEFLRRIVDFLNSPTDHGFQMSPPESLITYETGTTVTFSINLLTQPSSDVVIPVYSSNPSEATTPTTSVVFTSANWNVPQSVQFTGVDDSIDDGDAAWTAVFAAAVSSDPHYNGLNPPDTSLNNIDNDTAGISVSQISGTTTSEAGTSVYFTVALTSQPLDSVSLAIASSDSTEAAVNLTNLNFTAANWSQPQTVIVTGLDDTFADGTIAYSVIIAPSSSSDPLYNGIDPVDFSLANTDDDVLPPTKFFVVDDNASDQTFEYDASGGLNKNYPVSPLNSAPRGVATITAANRLWVLDASRTVFVYDNAGTLLGSWRANLLYTVSDVQGLATDGTHIWIVDRLSDRIYFFADAAERLSGEQSFTRYWLVNRYNTNATDIVFGTQGGQRYVWVVDDSAVDRVFRYTLTAANVASSNAPFWQLNSENSSPTGITLDPSNATMDIWVSDIDTNRVYRYEYGRTLAAPTLTSSFGLAAEAGNTQPQGIADPPPPATESSLRGYKSEVDSAPKSVVSSPPASIPALRQSTFPFSARRPEQLAASQYPPASNIPARVNKLAQMRSSRPNLTPSSSPQNTSQPTASNPQPKSLQTNTTELDLLFADPVQLLLI